MIYSIAAASIIAKVTRDRIMKELDHQYPMYNLGQHKGYPTFEHRNLLMKFGPSDIHRLTFGPVKNAMIAHPSHFITSNNNKTSNSTTLKKIVVPIVKNKRKKTIEINSNNVSTKIKSKKDKSTSVETLPHTTSNTEELTVVKPIIGNKRKKLTTSAPIIKEETQKKKSEKSKTLPHYLYLVYNRYNK